MKKIFKYISFAIAISASLACTQEIDFPQQPEGSVKIRAVLEGADQKETKTSLGAPVDNIYPVLWSEGDEIKILTAGHRVSDGVGTKMSLISGAGENVGVFSGDVPALPAGCQLYYAVYPYTAEVSIGDGELGHHWQEARPETESEDYFYSNYVIFSLPAVQKYAKSSFASGYNPSLAITKDAASQDAELRFKNLCGLLQLNITGNIKIGKITLTNHVNCPLWGTLLARYRASTKEPIEEYALHLYNDQTDEMDIEHPKTVLTLDCGEGVQLGEEPTDFYFALPVETGALYWDPGQSHFYFGEKTLSTGFTVRVYDTNGNEVYTQIADTENSIIRSKIRQMPVIDIRSKELTDLSANGTANSYIVPANTSAKFYAGYRGSTSHPVGDIAEAEILWETQMTRKDDNSISSPAEGSVLSSATYDPATGYVTVQTGASKGNALVAVKDGSDKILWSWHIWVTDYNPDGVSATTRLGTAEFMDRNLGALGKYTEENYARGNAGLKYQWGRKDPMDRVEDLLYKYYPSTPFSYNGTYEIPGSERFHEELATYPTTRYISGIGSFHAVEWNYEKNENDPCPPGWQVANIEDLMQLTGHLINRSWDASEEKMNYWYSKITRHDEKGYFTINDFVPAASFPTGGNHWTNRHSTLDNTHSYGVDAWEYKHEGDLMHVRCQRTSTVKKPEYIDLSAEETANSYMVEPGKHYKFNALVKGNSNATVGAVTRLGYVYMTENRNNVIHNHWSHGHQGGTDDRTVIRDVHYRDGYIYFSTSLDEVYGNVVISVEDIHRHTLWSWHIWSVDYDNPESNYDEVYLGDKTRKLMKMNLGALNNSPKASQSLGLMYQWGRKDPYLSAVAFDSNNTCSFIGNHECVSYDSVNATVEYAVIFPYKAMNAKDETHTDWLAVPDNSLWGAEKTMYDPCPPGWKVPSRPHWEGEQTFSGTFDYGLNLQGVYFPASGIRNFTSFNLNEVGKEGHYWYANPKDDGTAYSFYFDNSSINIGNNADYKAQCNSIRCEKIEKAVSVE